MARLLETKIAQPARPPVRITLEGLTEVEGVVLAAVIACTAGTWADKLFPDLRKWVLADRQRTEAYYALLARFEDAPEPPMVWLHDPDLAGLGGAPASPSDTADSAVAV